MMIISQVYKRHICKCMILVIFIMSFLPFIPKRLISNGQEYSVVYNTDPAYHFDGSKFEPGQWFGYYLVGGFLSQGSNDVNIRAWGGTHIPGTVPISLTNFFVPDVGVKLKTGAYCLRPKSPNWPNTVRIYEITPELCNDFVDISDHKINERDIDALNVAMKTLGLTNNAVNFSIETYAAMRFVCWYIGAMGWNSKVEFINGINEILLIFDNKLINKAKFKSLCDKTATEIEKSIGAVDTGYTDYMPAFAGRYYNQVPEIEFSDQSGDGAYTFTYNYTRPFDRDWEYTCPEGVTVEYGSSSVTFKSSVPVPEGMIEGRPKAGSKLSDITPSGSILVCKSDEPEAQDMLIPYKGKSDLICYARASGVSKTPGDGSEFPSLPEVKFYKYNETFEANYNISGEKLDAETNQKLKGAEFEILEQSPAGQPGILDNHWGSKIERWSGWKQCKRVETNESGSFNHNDKRIYEYIGTYCGGHDEQRQTIDEYKLFIEQCEEENAEAEEDNSQSPDDTADNEPLWDTEAMWLHHSILEQGYQEQIDACENFAMDSLKHFFHSESGVSHQKSDMTDEKQQAYNTFVNQEYDYTVREIRTRNGYMLHGKHSDDNPIPVIRTASSESGKTGYIVNPDSSTEELPQAYTSSNNVLQPAEHMLWGGPKGYDKTFITKFPPFSYDGSFTKAAAHLREGETKTKRLETLASLSDAINNSDAATNSRVVRQTLEESVQPGTKNNFSENISEKNFSDYYEDQLNLASPSISSPSISSPSKASPSKATPSKAQISLLFEFTQRNIAKTRAVYGSGSDAYQVAFWEPDWQTGSAGSTSTGQPRNNLFLWHIYNHRMEGELHINKRDMELLDKEVAENISFGDSQGDATLEGAIYGLYAAQDIVHPDGKTGKIFAANELVSISTTDRNGDASFLAVTESSLIYGSTKNNYDGTYQDGNNPTVYPDYKDRNGNQWIGRPLFLGRYYIKEIGRSEGYELSITGNDSTKDTNFGTTGQTETMSGTAWIESLAAGAIAGTAGTIITVRTEEANQGVELYLYNYPANTKFGIMRTGSEVKPGQTIAGWDDKQVYIDSSGVHVYRNESGGGKAFYRWNYSAERGIYTKYETDFATPVYHQYQKGEIKKDQDGNPVPVKNTAGEVQYTNVPEEKILPYSLYKAPDLRTVTIPEEIANIKNTANQLLKEAGYYSIVPASSKAPWYQLELTGTDEQTQVREILSWYDKESFYNTAQVQSIVEDQGKTYALLRFDYMVSGKAQAVLYGDDIYVKEVIPGGSGLYYYVKYPDGDYTLDDNTGLVTIHQTQKIMDPITMDEAISDHIKVQFMPEYKTYDADTPVTDENGNPVPLFEPVPEISENTNVTATKTIDYLTDTAVYDAEKGCFILHIKPDRLTESEKNGSFKIETEHPGMTSVNVAAQTLHVGEYLKYVLDVTAFACSPTVDWTGTYMKDAVLSYDSGRNTFQDGGTRSHPISVTERIIKQKIKIKKNISVNGEGEYQENTNQIHKDWFTENFGGYVDSTTGIKAPSVTEMDNFRFKIFLKSNLERLYRDEAGFVIWMDRDGKEVPIDVFKDNYPAEVQKIFTKVSHTTDIFKDSQKAVIANEELYSFNNNLIASEQNEGYTKILEMIAEVVKDDLGILRPQKRLNYEKFFDGITVANKDKWHISGETINTSYKPFPQKNEINTSDIAKENAKVSDAVRQFAIGWYLDQEVEKLIQINTAGENESKQAVTYSDELYDTALYEAIKKANNYLKPFFNYDLDSVYSIAWDLERDGGKDEDVTTLSADILYPGSRDEEGYYYGISRYLPYGTYVITEVQPELAGLNDFPNKHYQTDQPREIVLPSVYEDDDISIYNQKYVFDSRMTPEQQLNDYKIRFQEEWPEMYAQRQREYVIQAHNHDGDFKIFKYGLDKDKIGTNFILSQKEFSPLKDYYLFQEDGTNGYYLPSSKVSRYYHYASVSEDEGVEDSVRFPTVSGFVYRDGVKTMEGEQMAYEGLYAPMLVPWSIREPAESDAYDPDGFTGYGDGQFTNRFYSTKFRIEKLDTETGENILHDNAIFAIYSASRDDSDMGDGEVKFYDKETVIRGTKEFLTAMGAEDLRPFMRMVGMKAEDGNSWVGVVPAGTPVCRESEQIFLTDENGNRTGEFQSFSTMRDGFQGNEESMDRLEIGNQNVGYLETPKPLGAGVYVICEMKPTYGYERAKPIAVEVYSDKVTYYQDGDKGEKVRSTIYRDGETDMARIYVHNKAVRMEVDKLKSTDTTVTYPTDTRYEGSEIQLKAKYGAENLQFAYNHSGTYLGYGWKKGTLQYLISRKNAGEQVEIIYQDGIFAGYGLITRDLETQGDKNRNVTGAKLTLYDAIEVTANHLGGDYGYDGVVVERDRNSNVISIQVKKGYGGQQVLFAREKSEAAYSYSDEINDTGAGTWSYKTIDRDTADILYYSLSDLSFNEIQKDGSVLGYDKDGNRIRIKNQSSVYARKNGRNLFELTGSKLDRIIYSTADKSFQNLEKDVKIYHLDESGRRDALVDPVTGMAYVKEGNRILVWPVQVEKTLGGAVIAVDKIKTSRIATFHADSHMEYVTGTLTGSNFEKKLNPVLNLHGLPIYYQKSREVYEKGRPIFDLDGDYVRYQYGDSLLAMNKNAYRIQSAQLLFDQAINQENLFHRQGESYILENTWLSGERYPNDPFTHEMTLGQTDRIKRVIPGNYILEEVEAPYGYTKGFPQGVFLEETSQPQKFQLENEKIKVEIVKTDAPDSFKLAVTSGDYQDKDETIQDADMNYIEGKGRYGFSQVSGSHLALYKARKVYTSDWETYPSGYYLEKKEETPATWMVENQENNTMDTVTGQWITDGSPKYFEGIPAGSYILEELSAKNGYVRNRMEVEVKPEGGVQTFNLKNDHTKLEIFKYYEESGKQFPLPNSSAAGLTVYQAVTDVDGNVVFQDGKPCYDDTRILHSWTTDDLRQYTNTVVLESRKAKNVNIIDWLTSLFQGDRKVSGFLVDFEMSYEENPDMTEITWTTVDGVRRAALISSQTQDNTDSKIQIWRTESGSDIRITIDRSWELHGNPYQFEYQFNYCELADGGKAYDTLEGMHRIDYVPFTGIKEGKPVGNYVLVEHDTPVGYEPAEPKVITITETGDIQRYSLENREKYIYIDKVTVHGYQTPGVVLGLYRASGDGCFPDMEEALLETWTTGEDGRYTEEDQKRGRIPDGYTIGDLRPHRISKIPYGTYYIAELKVPAYMAKNPPQKIQITADKTPVYQVVNRLVTGRLKIQKTAEDSREPLSGARFEVKNESTGQTWLIATGEDGTATLSQMEVAYQKEDGNLVPYWFQVKEITPPDYYQADSIIKRFQFDGSEYGEVLTYGFSITDKPTDIRFTKANFSNDMLVEGALIAIYQTKMEHGSYVKDGEPVERIKTEAQGFQITKKLVAGHTYMAEELETPSGMLTAKPIIFTLNESGTGISRISNDFSIITLEGDEQVIHRMHVSGRVGVGVTVQLKDMETGRLMSFPGTEGDLVLTKEEVRSGGIYEITEYTSFSDNSIQVTGRQTRQISLDNSGTYRLSSRTVRRTTETLTDGKNSLIDKWQVTGNQQIHTIENPVSLEPNFLKVVSETGQAGNAVERGDLIKYQVTYRHSSAEKADINVQVSISDNLELLRTAPAAQVQNQTIQWNLESAVEGKVETLEFVTVVTGNPGDSTSVSAKIEEETCTEVNPIAKGNSLTVKNRLSGSGKEKSDQFTYHVVLKDSQGKVLTGYYGYQGTESGRIKGEGDILLPGDGFITFEFLPDGTRYEVTQEPAFGYVLDHSLKEGIIGSYPSSAVFVNRKYDATIRDVLVKEGQYTLREDTEYTDGNVLETGKYRFSINDRMTLTDIYMLDKIIEVVFSKRDWETDQEIPGGIYQLYHGETMNLLYEFTKYGRIALPSHLMKPGVEYILREASPPSGYARGEDLKFTVSGAGVTEWIIMYDRPTEIEIIKIDENGRLLSGSKHQILDLKKQVVIPEFVFEGKPLLIKGKLRAGSQYYLRETQAPEGYLVAEDVLFTVPETPERITVTMVDPRKPKDPGEPDRPEDAFMYLKKIDGSTNAALKGAEFTIYRSDGSLYRTVITGIDGYGRLEMPPDGTYYYQETKACDGYLMPKQGRKFYFTIEHGRVTVQSCMVVKNYKAPDIPLQKISETTKEGLPYAELLIRNENGDEVFRGMTDERGYLYYRPETSGIYTVEENTAPEGYIKTEERITLTVHEDGTVSGEFSLKNQPELKREGYILVSYGKRSWEPGKVSVNGSGIFGFYDKLPKTGDASSGFPRKIPSILLILLMVGGVGAYYRFRRRKKDEKRQNHI